jgi:hypothetical protein
MQKSIDRRTESRSENKAMSHIQDTIEEAKLTAQQEAKIIINTIQRVGTEEAVENCVSVLILNLTMLKGRILVVKEETLEHWLQLGLKSLLMIHLKQLSFLVLILS